MTEGAAPPECRPEDVRVTVEWALQDDGGLRGWVVVANTGTRTCRLSGKPVLRLLAPDGRPLRVPQIVTLEWRHPGYAVVAPGQRARAPVRWAGWDGAPATGGAVVGWRGEDEEVVEAPAEVTGPLVPPRTEQPHTLTSSWFQTEP